MLAAGPGAHVLEGGRGGLGKQVNQAYYIINLYQSDNTLESGGRFDIIFQFEHAHCKYLGEIQLLDIFICLHLPWIKNVFLRGRRQRR